MSDREDWTASEVDLIVADYFDMRNRHFSGHPFVKSQRNAALQQLTGRSRGSIEFKHQNISAVLEKLGMPWLPGYAPLRNFQNALIEGIGRYLGTNSETAFLPSQAVGTNFADPQDLFLGPPPAFSPAQKSEEPESLARLARQFDPAARDARNRDLGRKGEEFVLEFERATLTNSGRGDLASQVRWVSAEDGDGLGYDIRSFDPLGRERLVEVKTTGGGKSTPFYISENERAFSEERRDAFRLVRLFDFPIKPKAFELMPPLDSVVALQATNYRASFGTEALN